MKKIFKEKDDLPVGINCIILDNNNQILLGKRTDKCYLGGTWGLIGGKLKTGETFEQGAIRELLEEVGIVVKEKDIEIINIANTINSASNHFLQLGVLVKKYKGTPKIMEKDKCSALEFFSLENLPNNLFPPTEANLKLFIKEKFYDKSCNINNK